MFSANMTITIVFAWEPSDGILAVRKRTFEFPALPHTFTTAQLMTLNVLRAIKSTRIAIRVSTSESPVVGLEVFAGNKYD